jgi:hypothetical protein
MSVSKQYLVKKDNMFVSWNGKNMTDRPSQAIRLSKTLCQRKYKGFQMIEFVEAYDQWFAEKKAGAAL